MSEMKSCSTQFSILRDNFEVNIASFDFELNRPKNIERKSAEETCHCVTIEKQ